MSVRKLGFLVPWAADGLGPQILAQAFGDAAMLKVVLALTKNSYARTEAICFRYA